MPGAQFTDHVPILEKNEKKGTTRTPTPVRMDVFFPTWEFLHMSAFIPFTFLFLL
jgi:hypothetical protein